MESPPAVTKRQETQDPDSEQSSLRSDHARLRDGALTRREVPTKPWQEWQGSAFARVRSRSLALTNMLQATGLSERERTGANVAGSCHAEGRGFESHHPLNSLQEGIFWCLSRQQMTFCMSEAMT